MVCCRNDIVNNVTIVIVFNAFSDIAAHGVPDKKTILKPGDVLSIDITVMQKNVLREEKNIF
jgi:hypothetical protein